MARIDEIAPQVFRISTYVEQYDLQFNQFLVVDDEPILYHTGMRALFPGVKTAMETVMDPAKLRWLFASHFEADECGAINEWLAVAPDARPAASMVAAQVSLNDMADRPAREMNDGETFSTGQFQWLFMHTPQVPHAWGASQLFETTRRMLLCADLFNHHGDPEPVTEDDLIEPMRQLIVGFEQSPFRGYFAYTPWTGGTLGRLAELEPELCPTMHGAAFRGDGASALRQMAQMLRDTLGG